MWVWVWVTHLVVAVGLTWPVVAHLRTRIPIGTEPTPTVPLFNLWTLRWNAHSFAHVLHGYWDAPIFFPTRGAFALSEPQPLTGFWFTLLSPLTGATGAYNLILIGFIVANGVAGTALAYRLHQVWARTDDPSADPGGPASTAALVLVGVLCQALPFVFNQLGVIQLIPLFPTLFALERLLAYRLKPGFAPTLGLGVAVAAQNLVSGYYGLFALWVLAIVAPILLFGRVRIGPLLRHAAAGGFLALALAGPWALAQQHLTTEYSWDTDTVVGLSATPSEWASRGPGTWSVPWAPAGEDSLALFPGGLVMGFALVTIVRAPEGRRIREVAALAVGAVSCALLSGGLRLSLWGWKPYGLLRDHVPGFDRLRSPFRAAAPAQALFAVLAGVTVVWIWRQSRWGVVAAVLLVTGSVAETAHLGLRTVHTPETAGLGWVRWLRAAPAGPVAMVPFPASNRVADYEDTVVAMLAALDHDHPLCNGYSGFAPESFLGLRDAMARFPDPESLQLLRDHHPRYVVLDRRWLDVTRRSTLTEAGFTTVFAGSEVVIERPPRGWG